MGGYEHKNRALITAHVSTSVNIVFTLYILLLRPNHFLCFSVYTEHKKWVMRQFCAMFCVLCSFQESPIERHAHSRSIDRQTLTIITSNIDLVIQYIKVISIRVRDNGPSCLHFSILAFYDVTQAEVKINSPIFCKLTDHLLHFSTLAFYA